MIRIGLVDFDSSHTVEFTKRLNHKGVAENQWVDGAQVVIGWAPPSTFDQKRAESFVKTFTTQLGLPMVDKPEEMIGKIDAVCIEGNDGSMHLERARPFLEAGIPTFIDKPFACSVKDARELIALAERKKTPLFSCSSLRYAPEVTALHANVAKFGKVVGCDAYSPGSQHPRNPGLFNYGIHGVETLYAVMGPGCVSVTQVSQPGADVVTGRWKDGRIGTVRATREGTHSYGFTAFCEKSVVPAVIDAGNIYRELLKKIVETFETRKSPLDPRETLEMVAFMEAAIHSGEHDGASVPVQF